MNNFENFEKSFSPKEKYLARLRHLRNDYLDEIPPERVKLSDPNYYKYKVRGNYFDHVVSTLEAVIEFGVISDHGMIQKINAFIDFATEEKDFSKFTTEDDIKKVNGILDEIIGHLS